MLVPILTIASYGCKADNSDNKIEIKTELETSTKSIVTGTEASTTYFTVKSSTAWKANSTKSWINLSPSEGKAGSTSVSVKISASSETRGATFSVTAVNGLAEISIPVFQMETGGLAISPSEDIALDKQGGKFSIYLICKGDFSEAKLVDWIKLDSQQTVDSNVTLLSYSVAANSGFTRNCKIAFSSSDKNIGINVTQKGNADIPDKPGATIKGKITCENAPIEGVVVSDGFEVTTTDKNGLYWLNSSKKNESVFISIPSGYMVDCENAFPKFWQATTTSVSSVEEHSFSLKKEPNSNHIFLATTDPHLANRQNYNKNYNDMDQYRNDFLTDIKSFTSKHSESRIYAICLGDLTWDIYWYDTGTLFTLDNYRTTVSGFPVPYFSVIGNHDYDMKYSDDFAAEAAFRKVIGPTYYSFNLGDVHYVVLDDIVYVNNGGDRSHNTLVDDEQLSWLKKDLSYVDKNKPLFVCMHCSAYGIRSVYDNKVSVEPNFTSATDVTNLSNCFAGFKQVHYLTGDTHINRAVAFEDMPSGYSNIFEHNMAAICATWWWTGYISKNSICKDGSEGGYMVFTNNGTDIRWQWKGMKVKASDQFRVYDMNIVKEYFHSNMNALYYLKKYPSRPTYSDCLDNTVWINVWNWDSGWKISVKEGSTELPVTQLMAEDPLHTLSYDIPRTVTNGEVTSSFKTIATSHIFSVVAASATSTLTITVTDRFGNIYTQNVMRPKAFSTDIN